MLYLVFSFIGHVGKFCDWNLFINGCFKFFMINAGFAEKCNDFTSYFIQIQFEECFFVRELRARKGILEKVLFILEFNLII